jgi:kinesin family protein 5
MSTKKNSNLNNLSHNSFTMSTSSQKNHHQVHQTNNSNFNINLVSITDNKVKKVNNDNSSIHSVNIINNTSSNHNSLSNQLTESTNYEYSKQKTFVNSSFNQSNISQLGMSGGNVKVMCRFRPISDKEREHSKSLCTESMDNTQVSIKTTNDLNTYRFSFDRIFGPKSSQHEVFNIAAKPIIESVLEGFNGTIFAYGQTSSGKTFTMMGEINNIENEGIIPRMVKHVFNSISNSTSSTEYIVKLSMMEIYMEKIKDLIETSRTNLNIREDKAKGIFVEDLSEHYVASEEEVFELIQIGSDNRTTGYTNMNDYSSRSHTILMLTIKSSNVEDLSTKTGKLFLVDLAGSEKISKTGATGLTLEEAKMINSSLTTLGMVINSLTDEKSSHIPYRESKITRILQESLGGNAKTCLIITCSPSSFNDSETLSTLRFGMRAKKIENKPKINKEISAAELKIELDKMESIVNDLEIRNNQLEKFIVSNGLQIPKQIEYSQIGKNKSPRKMIGGQHKQSTSYDEESSITNYDKNSERKGSFTQKNQFNSISTLKELETETSIKENDNKLLNLIADNKNLAKKLNEAEEALERYLIEAGEKDSYIKKLIEKKYSFEEILKESVSKIEFLERKIKKLKYEQEEKSQSELYNVSEEPIQTKLKELVNLVSENSPGFEFHQNQFIREVETLIKDYKLKSSSSLNDNLDYDIFFNKSISDIKEVEEAYKIKIDSLKKEIEQLSKSEKLKMHQLINCEKQILTMKDKIEFYENKNNMTFDEKNYVKRIETLESSLNKSNNLYYQISIQKSVLSLENEVLLKMIARKNEEISKFEKGEELVKEKDEEVSNFQILLNYIA